MGIPRSLILPAFVACLSGVAERVATAQPLLGDQARPSQVTRVATITTGSITGLVLDERGVPVADVVISAVGGSSSFAVSGADGQFALRALPPGPYLIRAHREGYVSPRHTIITVRSSGQTNSTFTLRRTTSDAPRVLTAGAGTTPPDAVAIGRDDSETAWRLRRLKRSILRDSTLPAGFEAKDDWFVTESLQFLGRAVESSARLAGAFLTRSPFEGEVNLLTTGAFDAPGELLQLDRTRGVAFFAVGAPVGQHGDWTVKAALNQGDLSSWIVAGNYLTRNPASHRYQFGMSYGVQRYEGGNVAALAAISDVARNVGAVYAYDDWQLSDRITLGYGGHYAHYDYLSESSHFSPRLNVTIEPFSGTRLHVVASRRVAAPGAEEFLPPSRAQVLPPQRTFAPLTRAGFAPEDMRHVELGVDREFDGLTVGVRAFRQSVDDQFVTVFGLRTSDMPPAELGHYFVGSAGDVAVQGWGASMAHALNPHVRGTVAYSLSNATWSVASTPDRRRLLRTSPSAVRDDERIQDVTASLDAEVPASATRVFVLYKLNSAYTRADNQATAPGVDARWDVQVIQGLPFMNFTGAQWEMLVGVRNVFRESFAEASVYDEILVIRPPKRLVGGITVKF